MESASCGHTGQQLSLTPSLLGSGVFVSESARAAAPQESAWPPCDR